MTDLANALLDEGGLDESECSIDAPLCISQDRRNRVKRRTQDGRRLRRYERRWLVEQFFAWIQWQRLPPVLREY